MQCLGHRHESEWCFFMSINQNNVKTIEGKKDGIVTVENVNEVISMLTVKQISFFLERLWERPERIGVAQTSGEGALAASLHQRGIIRPFGRNGQHILWQPALELFHPPQINLMKQIVNWKEIPGL